MPSTTLLHPTSFFIDEFYKLNDGTSRGQLLNLAFYRLHKTGAQFFLAAPAIEALSVELPEVVRDKLMLTDYATVVADTTAVSAKNDIERRAEIGRILAEFDGPTIIFCQSPKRARDVTEWLMEDAPAGNYGPGMHDTARWLEQNISGRWSLPKALRMGVGAHHGKLPRWLGPLTISNFNRGRLGVLVCTNSLIEGVNTSAKNIIILDRTIAKKTYDYFTFNNIRGRTGRMLKHFVGNIFLFHPPPQPDLPSVDIPGLSQSGNATDGLLLAMDEEDRSDQSNDRLREIVKQKLISLTTLRLNSGIDPNAQIALAEKLLALPRTQLAALAWRDAAPKWEQLLAVCDLIWNELPPDYHTSHGPYTARMLAFFTQTFAEQAGDMQQFIPFVAKDAETDSAYDMKVSEAFDFVRFWIDHNLPIRLRALDRILKEVLPHTGTPAGDFEQYAARLESGFQAPLILTLEEYGVPSQLTRKVIQHVHGYSDLDTLLARLSRLSGNQLARLTDYEQKLLRTSLKSAGAPLEAE